MLKIKSDVRSLTRKQMVFIKLRWAIYKFVLLDESDLEHLYEQ